MNSTLARRDGEEGVREMMSARKEGKEESPVLPGLLSLRGSDLPQAEKSWGELVTDKSAGVRVNVSSLPCFV